MRVLISASWLGGAGGAERALHSILRALTEDRVDVVVRQQLGGHLAEVGPNVRVSRVTAPRWYGASLQIGAKGQVMQRLANPIRRALSPRYDVLVRFYNGPDIAPAVSASVKLFVPSGNHISAQRSAGYDYVALQSPDNESLVERGTPTTLLPPPLYPLAATTQVPPVDLPEAYYLTVFNPYDPIKGVDDLLLAVSTSPLPIVWCHSQQTVTFPIPEVLRVHDQIIHVEDPSPAELRYLYERCTAYVAFSRSEGFGWSIADALRYSPRVASRCIGVLTFPQVPKAGIVEVGRDWDLDWGRLNDEVAPTDHDLAWLSGNAFRDRLQQLVDSRRQTGSAS